MTRSRVMLTAALAAVVMCFGLSGAQAQEVTVRYVGGTGDATFVCSYHPSQPGIGGVCFRVVTEGGGQISVVVKDANTKKVPVVWTAFHNYNNVGHGQFCSKTTDPIVIPYDANYLSFAVGSAGFDTRSEEPFKRACGTPQVTKGGTITATVVNTSLSPY